MKKKQKSEKPKKIVSSLFTFASKLILKFKGIKVTYDNSELLKYENKPFILINNHYSNEDHFIMASVLKGRQVNYVVSKHFFMKKKTAGVLNLIKAISKDQFKNDIVAIRKIRKVIDENGVVYIAPAGQVTLTGANNFIPKSIVKLVRMCKVPVVAMQEYGAHLCLPKWGLGKRRYPIYLKFVTAVSEDDLKTLNDDEIYKKIYDSIDINDYKYQEKKMIKIKSDKIIEGLDGALFICPKCKKALENSTNSNIMRCNSCGNTVYMDEYGFLNPQTKDDVCFKYPYDWYKFQKEEIKKQILSKKIFVSSNVVLKEFDEKKKDLVDVGFGTLILNDSEFYYEGTENGKEIRKDFDLEHLIQTPFSPHTHIEIPDVEKFYHFKSVDKKMKLVYYSIVIEVMHEMRGE